MNGSSAYSPRPRSGLATSLKLGGPESFQLFIEGVAALASFEQDGRTSNLDLAIERLSECVERYHDDLLPRLYLGIAQSLRGYDGLETAVQHLRWVVDAGDTGVIWPARYNLAAALVESYDQERFREAKALLRQIEEAFLPPFVLAKQKATKGFVPRLRAWVYFRWWGREARELAFQSWILRLFIQLHELKAGVSQQGQNRTQLLEQVQAYEKELESFRSFMNAAGVRHLPGASSILADYHNNSGHCAWCHALLTQPHDAKRRERSLSAEKEFRAALCAKPGWEPALANLAAIKADLLREPEVARHMWESLAAGSGEKHYAHYRLGLLWQDALHEPDKAREYLKVAAPHIPSARIALERLDAIDGRMVSIRTEDGEAEAFYVTLKTGQHPGVLIWPDGGGLRPAHRTMARRLAARGYAVLVVNQYYRSTTLPLFTRFSEWESSEGKAKTGKMQEAITEEGASNDASTFVFWLHQQIEVDRSKKIATVGYGEGAVPALRTAVAASDRVGVVVSLDGNGCEDALRSLSERGVHVLFCDATIPAGGKASEVKAEPAETDPKKRGIAANVETFKARPGWCTMDNPAFDEEEACRAMDRMVELFQKHL